ncbi:MAG: helix-turn-helix domain-containing protein [Ignavibacteria bacterium]|nr:helix-turn-helix domain-containing protein [Ignavibacteria bacterium]MCC7159665.1 helix-turn-helix domain-containing protein [Ignavibacteria bacterium]
MLKQFGQDLKKLRELRGISVAEISAESRINPKFLYNIENGIFDFVPETYIRSFIKAYAKAIDENENQILNEYDKAKAGFYAKRKFASDDAPKLTVDEKLRISVLDNEKEKEKAEEPVYQESIKENKPDYMKPKTPSYDYDYENDNKKSSIVRKILLGVLILAICAGIYFLVDYLNHSGDKKSDVKPKSFNEISSEYENKISGKIDSTRIKDSLKTLAVDSLRLTIKALKDIKIKVYIDDETSAIDGEIAAKDSIIVSAKSQFRFSANANQSVEIYLNGRYLRKPTSTSGTSIKNLVINKDGIVTQ